MGNIFDRTCWPSLCVLVLGILLRFLYLDADPQYDEWIGYITDEGRWVQHARSLSLHGKLFDQNIDMHFYLAPLYQLANYSMFELAGVSLLTSRMLSAICGSVVLILIWQRLRYVVSSQALFLCVTLLAFQLDFLILSRIAVPEMAAILLQVLIYFQIVKSSQSAARIAMVGSLVLLAVGIKATTALLLPIFSLIIIFMPRRPDETRRWRSLASFWAGMLLPMALICVVSLVYSPAQSAAFLSSVEKFWNGALKQFLVPSNIYSVISFPFVDSFSPTLNLWLLGLWLSALAWKASEQDSMDFESYRYLATSAVWFASYAALMLAMEYFPTRYKVHVLIPMAICLTVGISHLQRLGIQTVVDTFSKLHGAAAVFWLSFLCLPTAVVLSPLAASAVAYFAVESERLSIKLACVAIMWAGTTYVAARRKQSQLAIGCLLMFPLIAGMTWAILSRMTGHSFWPTEDFRSQFAIYGLMVLLVSGISIALWQVSIRWGLTACGRFVAAGAMFYLPIALVRIVPGYFNPQYSIRDASRDLGGTLAEHSSIATIRAEGLFNENNLRYKSFIKVDWPVEKPDILVIAFRDAEKMPLVKQNYHLTKSYKISVSPEYQHGKRNPFTYSTAAVIVSVYMSNEINR